MLLLQLLQFGLVHFSQLLVVTVALLGFQLAHLFLEPPVFLLCLLQQFQEGLDFGGLCFDPY